MLAWKIQMPPTTTLVDELASPSPPASSVTSEEQEYPKWIKAHASQKVATVGSVCYKPREPQQCCDHSFKQCKRAQHLLEEEWQDLGNVSWSASSEGSPELMSQDGEGEDADLSQWAVLRLVWPKYH